VQKVSVRARLTGPVAQVEVEQTFTNMFDEAVETVYIFPLSPSAAVYRFRMRIGDRVVHGDVRSLEEARATYEKARTTGHRTSLLEQERDNVFTVQVGNLAPGPRRSTLP
jgi:Ca-activated chloride channel family protein